MTSGFVYYSDGYGYSLRTPTGQKGDKGDKGNQGDIGPTGSYQDGYSSLAVEKAIYGFNGSKLANIAGNLFSTTISSDLLTDFGISGTIVDIDCSDDMIYFITDSASLNPIYGIDFYSKAFSFNPTVTDSIVWKQIKYARLNGIEVIALVSDNGFAYYDITNATYYGLTSTFVASDCSYMYVDSNEVSFFTRGSIFKLTSDGTSLILDELVVQPNIRYSVAFHKAFGCYFNCDISDTSKLYITDSSNNVEELDIGFVNDTQTIGSDSEYIYCITPLEDVKKIKKNPFSIVDSLDLSSGIGGTFDPYVFYYDGSRFISPNPDSNKIFLYYPSQDKIEIIDPSIGMDISCIHNFYNRLGFILSGGTDLISVSYKKKDFLNKTYHNAGVFKKPTMVTFAMSPYTVTAEDSMICCDTTGGAITIDLPSDISLYGLELQIFDIAGSASLSNITISGTNANNGNPKVISTNFGKASAYCFAIDGGPDSYWVIS